MRFGFTALAVNASIQLLECDGTTDFLLRPLSITKIVST